MGFDLAQKTIKRGPVPAGADVGKGFRNDEEGVQSAHAELAGQTVVRPGFVDVVVGRTVFVEHAVAVDVDHGNGRRRIVLVRLPDIDMSVLSGIETGPCAAFFRPVSEAGRIRGAGGMTEVAQDGE